jgi:hypothetical protein
MSRRSILVAAAFLFTACMLLALRPTLAAYEEQRIEIAGVYQGDAGEQLTLAIHPYYPGIEYIGILITGQEQRVYAVNCRNDDVKGCHCVIYDGMIANQKAIELKLNGQTLTMRYYDGPTLTLKKLKKPE